MKKKQDEDKLKLTHIGIKFGDNDFYYTFTGFLKSIAEVGIKEFDFSTKEKFCELCNKSILGFYIVFQNQLRYNCNEGGLKHTHEYLQIEPKHVFFNEEVDNYLAAAGGELNGEFFAVKLTDWNPPYVYSA